MTQPSAQQQSWEARGRRKRTAASWGITGSELNRLADAVRFVNLHRERHGGELWWATTDNNTSRPLIHDAWKRITRLQHPAPTDRYREHSGDPVLVDVKRPDLMSAECPQVWLSARSPPCYQPRSWDGHRRPAGGLCSLTGGLGWGGASANGEPIGPPLASRG
jgi:hypothetical protein